MYTTRDIKISFKSRGIPYDDLLNELDRLECRWCILPQGYLWLYINSATSTETILALVKRYLKINKILYFK